MPSRFVGRVLWCAALLSLVASQLNPSSVQAGRPSSYPKTFELEYIWCPEDPHTFTQWQYASNATLILYRDGATGDWYYNVGTWESQTEQQRTDLVPADADR